MNKYVLLICILFLFSCKKESITEHKLIKTLAFSKVEVNNPFDVYLIEDTVYSVEISGNTNSIQDVVCSVENGLLKIKNNRKFSWTSPEDNKIEIYIHSKPLSVLTANETCNIKTLSPITSKEFGIILKSKANQAELELNCHTFYYWNNFPTGGKLKLSGKADEIKIWNFAIMSVDAKNLLAQSGLVENSSKGDCEVNIQKSLRYSLKGSGNIHLYGNPAEITEVERLSSGMLIKH